MYDANRADWAAFLLRLGIGVLLLAHAGLKVFVFTVPGTVGYFESIGYPGFFAYLVILGEAGAGLLLVAGLYTRLMSLAMLPILIGALIQHLPNGWMFGNQGGGWEFPAFWTLALVVQAILGDGKFALGGLLADRGIRLPLAAQA
jgi:putative oxidoreductase